MSGEQGAAEMDGIELAVGGVTDRCGLCTVLIPGREAVGAFGLDGVICPACAENIARYTPRRAYIGLSGGATLVLYQYHSVHEASPGVIFIESSTLGAATPAEVIAYYHDLPRRVRELVWWFGGDQWPGSYGLLDDLTVEGLNLQRALEPELTVGEPAPRTVRAAVQRLPRPFLAAGGTIAVPTNDRPLSAVRAALPAAVTDDAKMSTTETQLASFEDGDEDGDDEGDEDAPDGDGGDKTSDEDTAEQVGLSNFGASEGEVI